MNLQFLRGWVGGGYGIFHKDELPTFLFAAEGFFAAVGTEDWLDGFACGTCAQLSYRLNFCSEWFLLVWFCLAGVVCPILHMSTTFLHTSFVEE